MQFSCKSLIFNDLHVELRLAFPVRHCGAVTNRSSP